MFKKLLQFMNFKDESGAALVIVAISMTVLLGFTALVIDVGQMYLEKSKVQNAVDAAALAGAQKLLGDASTSVSDAKAAAREIAEKNGFTPDSIEAVPKSYIKVKKEARVPLTFARVFGLTEADVPAYAKVIVGPLVSASGISPIAVAKDTIPNGTVLNCGSSKHVTGNCGFIRLDGTGAKDLKTAFINGGSYTAKTTVDTEKGEMKGPVEAAVTDIINQDSGKPQCQSASTADKNCSRVIYVAVIDTWEGVNNSVEIIGFAAYWVEKYDKGTNQFIGHFMNMVAAGEIAKPGTIGAYGVYGMKLDE
jgi:Flp pilus assembly protein TadG